MKTEINASRSSRRLWSQDTESTAKGWQDCSVQFTPISKDKKAFPIACDHSPDAKSEQDHLTEAKEAKNIVVESATKVSKNPSYFTHICIKSIETSLFLEKGNFETK